MSDGIREKKERKTRNSQILEAAFDALDVTLGFALNTTRFCHSHSSGGVHVTHDVHVSSDVTTDEAILDGRGDCDLILCKFVCP